MKYPQIEKFGFTVGVMRNFEVWIYYTVGVKVRLNIYTHIIHSVNRLIGEKKVCVCFVYC